MQAHRQRLWKTGVYTGRAIASLVLLLTAAQWFMVAYQRTVEDLALAMLLSTVSLFIIVSAWVINKCRQ